MLDKQRMSAFTHLEHRLKQVFDFFVAKFIEAKDKGPVQSVDSPHLE